jgi:hypothetical protein
MTEAVMGTALFINGIFDSVLTEILNAQIIRGGGESFLQPYKGQVISMLKERSPTPSSPVTLYISTTENLSKICYTAEIVKWEDKRELSESRRQTILRDLKKFQPNECEDLSKGKAANLITIRNLRSLETLPPTSFLIKKSDGFPLKKRNRAGGWSEVYDRDDLAVFSIRKTETEETNSRQLTDEIAKARSLDAKAIQRRLNAAPKIPERVLLFSVGFRRNADVIVAVLNRANGVCE